MPTKSPQEVNKYADTLSYVTALIYLILQLFL
jgi:hypothetical protein